MEELTISVENKDYVVQLQETKGQMLYVVKAGDADVVFTANDSGDIVILRISWYSQSAEARQGD